MTSAAYPRALRVDSREEAYVVVRSLPSIVSDFFCCPNLPELISPQQHANLLTYIVGFLKFAVKQTEDPKERATRLARLGELDLNLRSFRPLIYCATAAVFSTVLLRPSATPDSLSISSIPRRRVQFITYLLTEPEQVNLAIGK